MTELTVIGAGAFGLCCAWECLRRGTPVRVLEAQGIGAGSSGGLVGALAPHVPEQWNEKKEFQFESLRMAEGFWAGVAAAGGLDPGYARTGRLQPLGDDTAVSLARDRAAAATAHWRGAADWRLVRAGAYPGWAPPSASGWQVLDTLSARISPRGAARALAAAIRLQGGVIETGQRIDWRRADFPGPVLWACGAAGLSDLSAALGRPVGAGIKGQAASLRPEGFDARALPQLFAAGVHIVPQADGTVAVGSTTERDFDAPGTTDVALDAVIAAARGACPALAHAPVVDRWAGVRPRARTRAPMLGPWPGRPGHFIVNGGFKIGFGMAPKVAEVMARLILEGEDAIPAGFRVEASL